MYDSWTKERHVLFLVTITTSWSRERGAGPWLDERGTRALVGMCFSPCFLFLACVHAREREGGGLSALYTSLVLPTSIVG